MSTNLKEAIDHYIPTMPGWSTTEKCYELARLIEESKAQTSVELGVFAGRALISMAFAHRHTGGAVWGFDPWKAAPCLEGNNDEANDDFWAGLDYYKVYQSFIHQILVHNLLDHSHWGRYKSDRAVGLFEDDSIGVLHQDSNHSEQVSCDEVERWNPKMKSGAYWIMDDTDWHTTQKAQGLLLSKGYEQIKDEVKWKVFKKR